MVKPGRTVEEARDSILHRIGGKVDEGFKDSVIQLLNDGIIYVSQRANWRFLRKHTTFTVTGSESKLPSDCDRIICFRLAGQSRIPTEVGPTQYEMAQEWDTEGDDDAYTNIYLISKVDIGPDGTANSYVKFWREPGDGTEVSLWYTKWLEQITEDDLSSHPPLPPHIWDLVIRKALMDAMRYAAVSATSIRIEQEQFTVMLEEYKRAEDFDGGSWQSMELDPKIENYNRTKGRQRG